VASRSTTAWKRTKPPFLLIPQALNIRDASGTVSRLIALVKAAAAEVDQAPVLIIIDTLNRSFGDGSENSDEDMREFIMPVIA